MTDSPTSGPANNDGARYAKSLLSLYLQRAGMEADVLASYEKQQHLKELAERLMQHMDAPEDYPNKNYNGLAEAVRLSVILYEYYPDQYAHMMSGIAAGELDTFLDSFDGMRHFDMLINGLADDHDYVFSEAKNRIEDSGPDNWGEPGLCPAKFLVRVQQALIAGERHGQDLANIENPAPAP